MPIESKLQEARIGAQMRLARHYVDVVVEADHVYRQGWDNSVSALAMFDVERAQIEQWETWLAEQAEQNDEAARLLVTMISGSILILDKRLTSSEMLAWHERALNAARRIGDTAAEAIYLRSIAISQYLSGDTEGTRTLLLQALAFAERHGHWQAAGVTLIRLAILESNSGALDEARNQCKRAVEWFRQRGDERGERSGLNQLGWIATNKGEWDEADTCLQQAYAISLRLGDQIAMADDLNMLGIVLHKLGNRAEATRYRLQALELARHLGDQRKVMNVTMHMGASYDNEGNYAAARDMYLQALETARRMGSVRYEADILGNLGFSEYLQGNYADAMRTIEQTTSLFRAQNRFFNLCVTLANIIPVYLHLGRYDQAQAALQEGVKLAVSMDAEPLKATMVVAAAQTWVTLAQVQPDPAAGRTFMEYGAYWSGLILVCPGAEQENRDEIEKLRPVMETLLGVEHFNDLLKQGGEMFIDDVVNEILIVLGDAG